MNITPKKTQKGLALDRLAQTLSVNDQYNDYSQGKRESSMLANPSIGMSEGITSENQEMYRTINFSKPSMMNSKGEKPLSMWDKMTLYDL